MVSSRLGPSRRELFVQAMSSVERGYDLLAPKFDHTLYRTPEKILDATTAALAEFGPFRRGLDVCCGTGAGTAVLSALCGEGVTGVDFSTGMLAQARAAHPDVALVRADVRALPFAEGFDLAATFGALGHFLPAERPALFAGVLRALRPGGLFAFPVEGTPPPTEPLHWQRLGFDLAMRVRNAVWRPPFVMYYRILTPEALAADLVTAGFTVTSQVLPSLGRYRDGSPHYHLVLARKPG